MKKDLKAQNVVSLTAIYVGTFFLVALVHWSVEEVFTFTTQLAKQAYVMAAITSFGAVLSNFLPNFLKHILVFFRFRNVLPGHRCKMICEKDPRLSIEHLENRWPELFAQDMEENKQNSYWYREIYSLVRNAPEVMQAHRSFLLYRDATSGLFVIMIGLLVWRFITAYVPLPSLGVWSLLFLLGVILLLGQAGRQSGNRMVANAVAMGLLSKYESTR